MALTQEELLEAGRQQLRKFQQRSSAAKKKKKTKRKTADGSAGATAEPTPQEQQQQQQQQPSQAKPLSSAPAMPPPVKAMLPPMPPRSASRGEEGPAPSPGRPAPPTGKAALATAAAAPPSTRASIPMPAPAKYPPTASATTAANATAAAASAPSATSAPSFVLASSPQRPTRPPPPTTSLAASTASIIPTPTSTSTSTSTSARLPPMPPPASLKPALVPVAPSRPPPPTVEAARRSSAADLSSEDSHPDEVSPEHSPAPASSTDDLRRLQARLHAATGSGGGSSGSGAPTTAVSLSSAPANGGVSRHADLIAALEEKNKLVAHLSLELEAATRKSEHLRSELDMLTQSRAGDASALAELKTQLKGHSQTIEMLVEEKLELQKLRTDAEQQAEAVRRRLHDEELRVRKLETACREREQENGRLHREQVTRFAQVEQLQTALDESRQAVESLRDESAELHIKVQELLEERQQLRREVQEAGRPAAGDAVAGKAEIKRLESIIAQQNSRIADLSRGVEQLEAEKDVLSERFRAAHERSRELEASAQSMRQTHEALRRQRAQEMQELEAAHAAAAEAREQASAAEAELQRFLEEAAARESASGVDAEASDGEAEDQEAARREAEEQVQQLQQRLATYEQGLAEKDRAIHELQRRLHAAKLHTDELESAGAGYQQLLDQARSDAETISEAMQHKRLLQEQVELLQTKIVDLSNENMELTSSLQTAAYKTAAKDEELTILKRHSEHDTARLVDEIADLKMQLADADGRSNSESAKEVAALKVQLAEATEQGGAGKSAARIAELEKEVAELRDGSPTSDTRSGARPVELTRLQDRVSSLSATVQQLEMERAQLLETVKTRERQLAGLQDELQHQHQHQSQIRPDGAQAGEGANAAASGNGLPPASAPPSRLPVLPDGSQPTTSAQEVRVLELEERNEQLADTVEELRARLGYSAKQCQELQKRAEMEERLTAQLALENETIGDYIALYQGQRAALGERLREKDRYIMELSKGRDEMAQRITQLQDALAAMVHNMGVGGGGSSGSVGRQLSSEDIGLSRLDRASRPAGDDEVVEWSEEGQEEDEEDEDSDAAASLEVGEIEDGSPPAGARRTASGDSARVQQHLDALLEPVFARRIWVWTTCPGCEGLVKDL